jgi:type I restriction-modification system DNA methylase subunit
LTPSLKVDDNVLKDIIKTLYLPAGPYEFSVFPADILGQVYEQFLGKVIIKKGRTVEPEEKPEVKKAGGVYYTPTYIVEYIVKHTVGKLVEGKTPEEVSQLRVLDPACGSGSFLIGAYQYLLDWHLTYYEEQIKKHKVKPALLPVYERAKDRYRLTLPERKRILLNNIYGVDIDAQAVEVTKLSLLLKVLEGESRASVQGEVDHTHRALPDLGNNIKCGNSLVSPDINTVLEARGFSPLSDEEWHKINPFDWQTEFAPIFKQGGFDAVIGNPPYLASYSRESVQMEPLTKEYYSLTYETVSGRINSFVIFMERGTAILRSNGLLGFIVPKTFLMMTAYIKMREALVRQTIEQVVLCGEDVFPDANVPSALVVVSKRKCERVQSVLVYKLDSSIELSLRATLKVSHIVDDPEYRINAELDEPIQAVLDKISSSSQAMHNLAITEDGINPGPFRSHLVKSQKDNPKDVKLIEGKDFKRYTPIAWRGLHFLWDKDWLKKHQPKHPNSIAVLGKEERFLATSKIVTRQTAAGIIATLDTNQYYSTNSVHTTRLIKVDGMLKNEFLLGVLNSLLIKFFFAKSFKEKEVAFPQVKVNKLRQLPIRTIDFKDKADKARHDKMVRLVTKMLDLNKKLPEAKAPGEHEKIERQIKATDREIDLLVYELYGLTEEEIAIVEGGEKME